MLAQFQETNYIYIYIYILKKKKKPYQATRSNSKRYNQLEKKWHDEIKIKNKFEQCTMCTTL